MNFSKSGSQLFSFPESPTAAATAKQTPILTEGRATHQQTAMAADTEKKIFFFQTAEAEQLAVTVTVFSPNIINAAGEKKNTSETTSDQTG